MNNVNKVLWELLQPSFLHLRGREHSLSMSLSLKEEKQSFASTTTLACCVGDFSLYTRHFHSRRLPMHAIQLAIKVDDFDCYFWSLLCCVFAANAFVATFVLVTWLMVLTNFFFVAVLFIKLCASAFSFNQL